MIQRITPFLWFDGRAEEAARFYTAVFPNSRITGISHYGAGAHLPEGSVMTVGFELDGMAFTALNGGPLYTFTEALSLVVNCETQAEVDHYWSRLTADGGAPVQCGWLKDRFGLSWQVVPAVVFELMGRGEADRNARMMTALVQMQKLDADALRRAWEG